MLLLASPQRLPLQLRQLPPVFAAIPSDYQLTLLLFWEVCCPIGCLNCYINFSPLFGECINLIPQLTDINGWDATNFRPTIAINTFRSDVSDRPKDILMEGDGVAERQCFS